MGSWDQSLFNNIYNLLENMILLDLKIQNSKGWLSGTSKISIFLPTLINTEH